MQMEKELSKVKQSLRVIIRANIFSIHRTSSFPFLEGELKFAVHVVEKHAL